MLKFWIRMLLLMAIGVYLLLPTEANAANNPIQMSVAASSDAKYATKTLVKDDKLIEAIEASQEGEAYLQALDPDVTIQYQWKGLSRQYHVTPQGEVVDKARRVTLQINPNMKRKLKKEVQTLRSKHYGELLPWTEVESILPRYSRFTVIDIETGLSFQAQRRAGSSHADVQPLTKEDSRVMKEIYGGRWSWDRRAVVIQSDGRKLAGSMHGMPHGGDGIPSNGFNGHFCIHFLGSTTHKSHHIDPAHQAMIQKAAGMLSPYLSQLSPMDLIDVWIAGVDQGNPQLLDGTMKTMENRSVPYRDMRRLSSFPIQDTSSSFRLDIPVHVLATLNGSGKSAKKQALFHLERTSWLGRWLIVDVEM
jgi:hypothetical protein